MAGVRKPINSGMKKGNYNIRRIMPVQPEIAELFAERFPRYAFSLPSWPDAEPSSQDPLLLDDLPLQQIEVLYLYGMGNGRAAFDLKVWLQEKGDRRLVFLEPRLGRIVHFLEQPFAKEVLEQQQVQIFHLSANKEKRALIQELAERYPFRGIFIVPGPGLPVQERQGFRRAKLQLLRKTALTHAHYMERLHSHMPLSNLLKNLPRLPCSFYVNPWKDAFRDIPIIICGAGPSLNHSIEALGKLENRAIIIAGGSAIAALTSRGIHPHLAVAIDPNPDEMSRLQNSFAFETPFFFSTRLYPGSFAACNGPFGYMRSGMSGIAELWFEEELGLTEPILGAALPSESLSVTTLCVSLAYHFGCNPILFAGLDLAYTNNRRYAEGLEVPGEPGDEHLQPVDRHLRKRDRSGRPVQSAVRWVMEASAISQFARRHKQRRWINCTSGGLDLKGIENSSLNQIGSVFRREWDLRGIIHQAIRRFPMPNACESTLRNKTQELSQSLNAVLSHLEILVENENPGKCALAEIEIKEELAYDILFFDVEKTLRKNERDAEKYWNDFQKMVLNCKKCFDFVGVDVNDRDYG
jgi:hypothetical protein